jgi:hypothetical protein
MRARCSKVPAKAIKAATLLRVLRPLRFKSGVPDGNRTRVTALKERCPRPLDDGDVGELPVHNLMTGPIVSAAGHL